MFMFIASAALAIALSASPAIAGDTISVNGNNNTVIKVDGGVIVNDTFYRVSDGEPVDIVNVDGGIVVNGKFYRDVEASGDEYYEDDSDYELAEAPVPQPWAVACVTPAGTFRLIQAMPYGTPCFGVTPFGPAHGWSGYPNDQFY